MGRKSSQKLKRSKPVVVAEAQILRVRIPVDELSFGATEWDELAVSSGDSDQEVLGLVNWGVVGFIASPSPNLVRDLRARFGRVVSLVVAFRSAALLKHAQRMGVRVDEITFQAVSKCLEGLARGGQGKAPTYSEEWLFLDAARPEDHDGIEGSSAPSLLQSWLQRTADLPTDQNSGTILPGSGEKAGGMGDGRLNRDKASKRAGGALDGDVPHSQQPPAVGNPLAGGELPTAPHAVLPASSVDALEREVLGLRAQLRSAQEDRGRDRDLLNRMFSLLEESLPDFKRSADAEQLLSQLRDELQKLRDAEARLTRAEVILAKEQVAKAGLAEELTKARAQAAAAEQRAEGALRELLAAQQHLRGERDAATLIATTGEQTHEKLKTVPESLTAQVVTFGLDYMGAFALILNAIGKESPSCIREAFQSYLDQVRVLLLAKPRNLAKLRNRGWGNFGSLEANRAFAMALNGMLDLAKLRLHTEHGLAKLHASRQPGGRAEGRFQYMLRSEKKGSFPELPPFKLTPLTE